MSASNDDLAVLRSRLEAWAASLPPEAQAFHRKRNDLVQQIRNISGVFQRRDPAEAASILRQFLNLEGDLPALEELMTMVNRTRASVAEFRAAPVLDVQVRSLVQKWSREWLASMDLLVRDVGDSKGAAPGIAKVKQIEVWANERKRALAILDEAGALRGNQKADALIHDWTRDFCEARISPAWLEEREASLKQLRALARDAGGQRAEPPALPEQPTLIKPAVAQPTVVQPAVAQPAVAQPTVAQPTVAQPTVAQPTVAQPTVAQPTMIKENPAPPRQAESEELRFFRIGQALAECQDLSDALEHRGSELSEFSAHQWRLRTQPDPPPGEVQSLENAVHTFREALLQRAAEEGDSRLERLRLRWQWFQAVYDARAEIAELVRAAEGAKLDAANRLGEFFQIVDVAEQRIYAIVNSNRPKLAAFVRKSADACRAQLEDLRKQARLISVDTALASIEKQIPEDPGSQIDARESFERLEKSHSLERTIQNLAAENNRARNEILSTAERLRGLARDLAAFPDAAETSVIAGRIPKELPTERPLDETAAELSRVEQLLQSQKAKIRERLAAELVKLRKDNLAWIRLLGEFSPEAETFAADGPAPEELEALGAAVDIEQQRRVRIADLTAKAVRQLIQRRGEAVQRLRAHLNAPAFETHPERETAERLLAGLDSLTSLSQTPQRAEFYAAYEAVADGEAFIDRIESARRAIPERLQGLEERFAALRECNGIDYRPDLARRGNTLLLGMHKAIGQQQWEPLNYQLDQADALIAALTRDALSRISAEVESLVDQSRNAAKTSKDAVYVRQIEAALKQLEDEGHLSPPSYAIRQRLNRLLGRRTAAAPEARTK